MTDTEITTPSDTTADEVDEVVARAARAAAAWKTAALADRAAALDAVADALDAAADALVPIAQRETHLAEARLRGELRRTTFQLRLFGSVVREGAWIGARIDHADPDWPMGAPRPDLRRQLESLGAVLVFAASNFPFAFSVAGGDTASALAAGSAVVVKAHGGHPELSAATTDVVAGGLRSAGAPDGLFQTIYGTDAGVRALRAPEIRAAAFTGSITGGRALFDIATSREVPIPFFGELGSVNPAFVTRSAAEGDAAGIAAGFLASVTGSAGQLCTKPGLLFAPAGSPMIRELEDSGLPDGGPLLNAGIAAGFAASLERVRVHAGVEEVASGSADAGPAPTLLRTTAGAVLADTHALTSEIFGPAALVAEYDDERQLIDVASRIEGQLTATIVGSDDDAIAADLLAALADRAGRVLWNQWPTGVSVTYAQQHGGPYPATTASSSTSVGTAAIERFVRPVAYQNVPDALLPPALQEANPLGIPRLVDGELRG
ncbi:aldehyde dehydrogenase family protein [Microbacterium indicum]|uniref:aldehyde dehydrogenase family protein n=1 Tax=Microbacterium indicum TaxID=358100 RepID=UPI000429B377|nr:aldehyde dehydrogenase family protein [Microbacterium indicum]